MINMNLVLTLPFLAATFKQDIAVAMAVIIWWIIASWVQLYANEVQSDPVWPDPTCPISSSDALSLLLHCGRTNTEQFKHSCDIWVELCVFCYYESHLWLYCEPSNDIWFDMYTNGVIVEWQSKPKTVWQTWHVHDKRGLNCCLCPGCRGGKAAVHSGPFITGRLQGEEHVHKPAHDTTRDPTSWGEPLPVPVLYH